MIPLLPTEFIIKETRLTWREILFGLRKGWIGVKSPVALAMERLVEEGSDNPLEIELAGLGKDELYTADELVEKLAENEPEQDEKMITEKWLYLLLAYAYEQRSHLKDPLEMVEIIYAEFDYPEEISHFVRYMPSEEVAYGTVEENIRRLYRHWSEYLNRKKSNYLIRS